MGMAKGELLASDNLNETSKLEPATSWKIMAVSLSLVIFLHPPGNAEGRLRHHLS